MQTPHDDVAAATNLSRTPEAWWKDKKGVADKIGKALLISQPDGDKVRRVVGLYQARASAADPQRVALRIAPSTAEGAQHHQAGAG